MDVQRVIKQYFWHFALAVWCIVAVLYLAYQDLHEKPKLHPPQPVVSSSTPEAIDMAIKSFEVAAEITLPPPPAPLLQATVPRPVEIALEQPIKVLHSAVAVAVAEQEADQERFPVRDNAHQIKARLSRIHSADATATDTAELTINSVEGSQAGRLWLTQIEHGKGPDIIFTWPQSRIERDWIRHRLYQCGVRLGKWKEGRLISIEPGISPISGFLRVLDNELSSAERSRLKGLVEGGQAVRLFTRALDIKLMSGFSQLAGPKFMAARTVTASYQRKGNKVVVGDINIDGEGFFSAIELISGVSCS